MLSTAKRLQKEAVAASSQNDENIVLMKPKDNIYEWEATIRGPRDSYYDGYLFDLTINVPTEYPMVPPTIRFKTKIFHPNIMFQVSSTYPSYCMHNIVLYVKYYMCYKTGEICLDILKKNWTPAWSLQSALRAIVALLADPAADR